MPVFVLDSWTTGTVSLNVFSPQENDLTISLSSNTDLLDGVTIDMENTSVTIPADETVHTALYFPMAGNVTKNDTAISWI